MKTFVRETMTLKAGAAIALLVAFCVIYAISILVPIGWWSYGASAVALLFILLTAIARVNDITEETVRWHARRLGLIGVAGAMVSLLYQPFLTPGDFPSWSEVWFEWALVVTWCTTPNMPPWWRLMGHPDPRHAKRDVEPPL